MKDNLNDKEYIEYLKDLVKRERRATEKARRLAEEWRDRCIAANGLDVIEMRWRIRDGLEKFSDYRPFPWELE